MIQHQDLPRHHFHSLATALIALTALLLLCAGCGGTASNTPTAPVSYDKSAGHIIVRLFNSPGLIYPSVNGVPAWTLYGDGTLIFKPLTSQVLLQAQLSPTEVQHILDVVVNQNAFFDSTHQTYGRLIPDVGPTLLSVNANSQHKEVKLFATPTTSENTETQHIFAIRDFLLGYHPATEQPYAPPGVVLLALLQTTGLGTATPWPYADISLAQVAAYECSLLRSNTTTVCSSNTTGVYPVYGSRGVTLLTQWRSGTYSLVSQSGKLYRIIVWPLLPEALTVQANGSHGVAVAGVNAGIWPLLAGFGNQP